MKYQQDENDLKSHLKEQIGFLRSSAASFDNGFTSEAKRLAVVIRVLLHDTDSSVSLLTLLKKKGITFCDTAVDYDPDNLLSTTGLVVMKLVAGGSGSGYVAPLDDLSPARQRPKVPFDKWWNKIIFVDVNGNKLTRKGLILSVCNKDGGAHIDPKLDRAYADLTRFKSLGWVFQADGKEIESTIAPELASVRQIAHEVLKSLKDEFPGLF